MYRTFDFFLIAFFFILFIYWGDLIVFSLMGNLSKSRHSSLLSIAILSASFMLMGEILYSEGKYNAISQTHYFRR